MRNNKSRHPRLRQDVTDDIREVERKLQDAQDALDPVNTAKQDARRNEREAKEVRFGVCNVVKPPVGASVQRVH